MLTEPDYNTAESKDCNALGESLLAKDMYSEALNLLLRADDINYFSIGRCLAYLKRYQEAILYFEKALTFKKRLPEQMDTYQHLSICHFLLGNVLDSLDAYKKGLMLGRLEFDAHRYGTDALIAYYGMLLEKGFDEHYNLAYYYKSEGDFEKTIALIKCNETRCIDLKGHCLIELGRYEEAALCFSKSSDWNFFSIGKCLAYLGKYAEAIAQLEKALTFKKRLPEQLETYLHISICHFLMGDKQESLAWYRRGLAMGSLDADVHRYTPAVLIRYYEMLSGEGLDVHYSLARQYKLTREFRKAADLPDCSHAACQGLRGECLLELREYGEAYRCFTRSDEVNLIGMGKCLSMLGRYDEAIQMLRRNLERVPEPEVMEEAETCYFLSFCYAMSSKKEAVLFFNKAEALHKNDSLLFLFDKTNCIKFYEYLNSLGADVSYRLARAYKDSGLNDKAIPLLKKLIEKESDNDIYQRDMGECLMDLNKFRDALPYLKKAALLKPEREWTNLSLGRCLVHLKDYRQAMAYLDKNLLVTIHKLSDYHTFIYMAICHYSTGNKESARSVLKKADNIPGMKQTENEFEKKFRSMI